MLDDDGDNPDGLAQGGQLRSSLRAAPRTHRWDGTNTRRRILLRAGSDVWGDKGSATNECQAVAGVMMVIHVYAAFLLDFAQVGP